MRYFCLILMLLATALAAEEEAQFQERVGIDPILRGVWQMHAFQKEGEEEQTFSPPLDFATVSAKSMTFADGKKLTMSKVAIMQKGDAPPANVVLLENGVIYACYKTPGNPDVLVQVLRDGKVFSSALIRVVQ